MCPECKTFEPGESKEASPDRPTGETGGATEPSGDGSSSDAGGVDVDENVASTVEDVRGRVDRGSLYAGAGAVSLFASVVTFVLSFLLTFSLLVGIFVLPLSGLFGITGTLLGYYSLVAYRSRLGAGVALVGTLEAAIVLGTVLLGLLIVFGVVALSNPFQVLLVLERLLEWLYDVLFGAAVLV